MAKILIGLVAATVIAICGFFGFEIYTQYRIAGEVEAAFEQIRATGGKASHGKLSFDLSNRTVKVRDIAVESSAQPPVSIKIADFTASGVGQPGAARFSADSIEATDIEAAGVMAAQPTWNITYKVPRITVKDYSGPAGLQRPPASSSVIDVYRFIFEQFAGITASSIVAPSLTGTMNLGGAMPGGGDFTYSGLAMQDIKGGKIATMKVDGLVFNVNMQQAGKAQKLTGNLEHLVSYDFDATAAAATLDPQRANDDRYYPVYRQISAGAYTITSEPGLRMRIDGLTLDDVGVRPSRLQLPALLATIPTAGAVPTPVQLRDLTEKTARLYEGIRVGNAEMRGLSMETPQGPFKLAAIRFNLEYGKIGEFALEGLDTRSSAGPFKIGRFALKSLDIANLLRMSALYANPAQKPSPEQALGLLLLLEGAEVKGVVAPYRNTNKPLSIDNISLNWGQFVGPFPTKAHLIAKMAAPIDPTDLAQRPLLAAGLDTIAIDVDLGAAWSEASGAFALDPVTLDVAGVAKASARVLVAKVPRGVFSANPQQASAMAAQIEAGTLEVTLRDTGGVDLLVAQYARTQNLSREAARQTIVENIKAGGEKTVAANPDAAVLVEALVRFVETSRQSLTIKLRPHGTVPALQLIQVLTTDPSLALAKFQIEASTGL